jgi:uncharacterized protein involved in response to NO
MTQVFLDISEPKTNAKGPVLFSAGHRPFFLFTALSGVFFIAAWVFALLGQFALSPLWHGHEMVFGFGSAAVSGFLMAAVPKWVGAKSFEGKPVVLLAGLWLLGRIGFLMAELFPQMFYLAWLDLLFLPLIAYMIAKLIIPSGNKRNFVVPLILFSWTLVNIAFHFWDGTSALRAGIYLITAIAALISGRVIPAFTQNALRMKFQKDITCTTPDWTHPTVLVLIFLVAFGALFNVPQMVSGILSALTAVVLFYRMWDWKALQTGFSPIVWVLHAAYIWLPIGFALKAVSELTTWIDPAQALHGLTTGAIGMLILAVASRAALGHSGRELVASKLTVASYIITFAAAVVRVLAFSPEWIIVSGVLWVIGYGLFAIVYAPILIKPRIDGQPG